MIAEGNRNNVNGIATTVSEVVRGYYTDAELVGVNIEGITVNGIPILKDVWFEYVAANMPNAITSYDKIHGLYFVGMKIGVSVENEEITWFDCLTISKPHADLVEAFQEFPKWDVDNSRAVEIVDLANRRSTRITRFDVDAVFDDKDRSRLVWEVHVDYEDGDYAFAHVDPYDGKILFLESSSASERP